MNEVTPITQEEVNYERIAEAIGYLATHFRDQPSLEETAAQVHMSPFHFQRIFSEWAGTSPKKFLQYISLAHAKKVLREDQATLFDAALETGLSGTGRLHDLFVNIEGMTPAEYKQGGQALVIDHHFESTRFGNVLVAATQKGICHLAFADDHQSAFQVLKQHFPNATFRKQFNPLHQEALQVLKLERNSTDKISLHLKGTPFQLKVWEALLKIPMGKLSTYGKIAHHIDQPNASRAVGTAIGSNPVAYLIPCHRVIQSTGIFGGYMWGPVRKTAMIGWELAQMDK